MAIRNGLSSSRTGSRDVGIDGVEQVADATCSRPGRPACRSAGLPATADDRQSSSPGKSYFVEQFADFHLDEIEKLRIVHEVDLVQEHDDAPARPPGWASRMCSRVWASGRRPASPPGSRRPSGPRR